ncbi:MAG: SDR family oxidoreductase [Candidatus Omnitrophota bacterium]
MIKILVTGASGFIGRGLCPYLKTKGFIVRGAVRGGVRDVEGVDEYVEVGDINESTDWRQALTEVDAVVHLAARVHVMNDSSADPLDAFRVVNVLGVAHLARMAAKAGIKRFVFISSIKVNGEGSSRSYSEEDSPSPEDAYGVSKREAEDVLMEIAVQTGLEVVILRLPLVYGPGVKANFRNLISMVCAGIPLPFKSVRNRRSFIYLGNVIDAIVACVTHPLAVNQIFLVSDGEDVSTARLLEMIARALNKNLFLFPFHLRFLKLVCMTIGREKEIDKLTGSLCADICKIRSLLGWKPPFTMAEGIKASVK